ncbi:MAG: S41 family peptidase [Leadbetterella sp.]|nr:S41 family peptidase [Leadbetterella sp.]
MDSLRTDDSLSVSEAYRRLSLLTSEIQDLHLALGLPSRYLGKEVKLLPLILRKFGEDFYVHYNQSEDSTLVRGTRLLAIDGTSPLSDFSRFRTLYGADFGNVYSKNYYAERNFSGLYTRWYGRRDSVKIRYSFPADSTKREETLTFLPAKEAMGNLTKRYKNVLRKNFDLQITDSLNRTAKLDLTSFRGKKSLLSFAENKFKRDLKRSFRQIESDSVQNLILDLRGNGGGAVVNVHRLISYLVPGSFRIYDTVSITRSGFRKVFRPYLGLPALAGRLYLNRKDENGYYRSYITEKKKFKPARRYRYSNRLFVLMDGGSYSATTFTISLLKNQDRGIFVGTPPGGANWGSFAGRFYAAKLSHSGIRVNLPLMKLVHSTEGLTHGDFFVQPDFHVEQGFDDFLRRKDTPVEFIHKLIMYEKP